MRAGAKPVISSSRLRELSRELRRNGARPSANDLHRPVIIAVVAVRVMQVTVYDVVDVVAVGDRLMTTAGSVDMISCVRAALVVRRALVRVGGRDLELMLVDMIGVHVMQVAVVNIVHVVAVLDRRMAAAGAMLMIVVGVMRVVAGRHA
jgi:hypothetical protein